MNICSSHNIGCAGKFILLGGEPSIYPHIREVIEFLKSHHLETKMFTNGTGITPDFARELALLKNHRQTIKGFCRTCEKSDTCYGCRGAAFQVTGDLLASDPLCWRNPDNLTPPKLNGVGPG
ncbi:radical SAM/SPASM domain-containing protein [Desulfobacter vibrioformis]|uniref:radical SAM/SPASM domain-containing protein n=1 Tax=Desulfobacter vibrioformis TaxID=34031 RepID=UPI0005573532|nr:radical SAM/SPASM domain-containing protein [Desulfobacter vibrioformis]